MRPFSFLAQWLDRRIDARIAAASRRHNEMVSRAMEASNGKRGSSDCPIVNTVTASAATTGALAELLRRGA